MKKYCIFLGDNFEDIEAVTLIDILRRAKVGLDIYGVGSGRIVSRSGVAYEAEYIFQKTADIDTAQYAGILIPGGPGVGELVKNNELLQLVKKFHDEKKIVFAICAGPQVLDRAGVLEDKKYTSYPGTDIRSGTRLDDHVVIDGNIITSQGVGTSLEAGIKLVEILVSREEAENQAAKVLYHNPE